MKEERKEGEEREHGRARILIEKSGSSSRGTEGVCGVSVVKLWAALLLLCDSLYRSQLITITTLHKLHCYVTAVCYSSMLQ